MKNFINKYPKNIYFWDKVSEWQNKGWTIALHGYTHVFETEEGGVNPVNKRSEFAGVNLDKQKQKISDGLKVFNNKGIKTQFFYAPAHTFDKNTLEALKSTSNIRVISDTIANDIYYKNGMYFIGVFYTPTIWDC